MHILTTVPRSALGSQPPDLAKATNNFEDRYLIGLGGSCQVFKAHLYGQVAAIKVFSDTGSAWVSSNEALLIYNS
jgi:hypothetical protein